MRIKGIVDGILVFDNGSCITFDHEQDCCEDNYADFDQLESEACDFSFQEPLDFEMVEYGFLFGNKGVRMFFVPCYSDQNGYYTQDVDILYNGVKVGCTFGELIYG